MRSWLRSEFAALHLPSLTQAFISNTGIMNTSVMMLNTVSHVRRSTLNHSTLASS